MPLGALDIFSIELVQLLLLTTLHLHSTKYANRCWNTLGLAIRVAQGLGLPWDMPSRRESQVAREMRRRVWYNCVILDRYGPVGSR